MSDKILPSIVIAYDTREGSTDILRHAQSLCATTKLEVHAVLAMDGSRLTSNPAGDFGTKNKNDQAQAAREHLISTMQQHLPNAGALYVHVIGGKAANVINYVAKQVHAELILIGTHGRTGVKRLVLGSVAEEVVRTAPCPVFVVREKQYEEAMEEACKDCLKVRKETGGRQFWCEQHSGDSPDPHVYSYEGPRVSREGPFILN